MCDHETTEDPIARCGHLQRRHLSLHVQIIIVLPLHSMQDNHPGELDLYCSGSCPIVLATANHYCGSGTSSLFDGKYSTDLFRLRLVEVVGTNQKLKLQASGTQSIRSRWSDLFRLVEGLGVGANFKANIYTVVVSVFCDLIVWAINCPASMLLRIVQN